MSPAAVGIVVFVYAFGGVLAGTGLARAVDRRTPAARPLISAFLPS